MIIETAYMIGVDLGQSVDYTAIAVLEQSVHETRVFSPDRRNRFKRIWSKSYALRHLERPRLGTPYPDIVDRVFEVDRRLNQEGTTNIVIDATGVGRPVVDMFRGRQLHPVAITITGGNSVGHHPNGGLTVPKRDLITNLQVLFQTGVLKIAQELPEGDVLRKELTDFRVKITMSANETYGPWREGAHDDLVFAVALATWWGERRNVGRYSIY